MLMEFLWNTFEKTGDIDSYVFFKQMEHSSTNQVSKLTEEKGVAASSK